MVQRISKHRARRIPHMDYAGSVTLRETELAAGEALNARARFVGHVWNWASRFRSVDCMSTSTPSMRSVMRSLNVLE